MRPGSRIAWGDAGPEHRSALQAFTCADPERARWDRRRGQKLHPRPWELAVQSHLRGPQPPVGPAERLIVGLADGTLVAAVHLGWTDDRRQLMILAIATTRRARGSGTGTAAIHTALRALVTERDRSGTGCGVFVRIDRRNIASQTAFTRCGFVLLQPDPVSPDLDYWVHDLLDLPDGMMAP